MERKVKGGTQVGRWVETPEQPKEKVEKPAPKRTTKKTKGESE